MKASPALLAAIEQARSAGLLQVPPARKAAWNRGVLSCRWCGKGKDRTGKCDACGKHANVWTPLKG